MDVTVCYDYHAYNSMHIYYIGIVSTIHETRIFVQSLKAYTKFECSNIRTKSPFPMTLNSQVGSNEFFVCVRPLEHNIDGNGGNNCLPTQSG